MKAKVLIEKEVEITTLEVMANVRYWEDAEIGGSGDTVPFRHGDLWCPIINVDSGVINDWPNGTTAKIHFKVCDEGSYFLKDNEGNIVLSIEDDYVPSILSPKDNGYGDYIIMDIDENGQIQDWKKDISSFYSEE